MVSMSLLGQLDCALPPTIAKALRDRAKSLQMMPEAATKALALIKEPDCSIGRFASIVEEDVKLAADILRLANSPFYSAGRPIGNLREAVVQVGFRQCQNLIHASCAASLLQRLDGAEERVRESLLQHSLVTAQMATQLSEALAFPFAGEEFTAGLMHDLGRLLLATLLPNEFHQVDPVDFHEAEELLAVESQVLDTDHAAVGCSFSAQNGLPDTICEAIRFHHQPARATISPALTAVVSAADSLANHVARGEDPEEFAVSQSVGFVLLEQSLVPTSTDLNALAISQLQTVTQEATR